uniref:WD_REPEATS_REGION domain-containing protein n=1 Tax=Elaeophora elaphi TaxID=1147741 RepID=A0A0R3RS45_9BILA
MANSISTDNDFEPAYVGYFFIVFSGLTAFIISLFVWLKWDIDKKSRDGRQDLTDSDQNTEDENLKAENKPNSFLRDARKQGKWKFNKLRVPQFEHPWLLTTLKGHVTDVSDLDFSSNGKYLASVSSDRSLYLWKVKASVIYCSILGFDERDHKFHRCSIELDHASHIVFAPDSKCVLMSLQTANKLDVYKMIKKEGTHNYKISRVESIEFPTVHTEDISNIGIACNGKFAMSASADNQLVIYSIHGEILKKIEPKLNILYNACISPCGRFVGVSGFTSDVFVFEVLFNRQGNFQDVKKAFELKGHSSGVYSFAFDQSSVRCVTASKDGTWKVYDTDVRYSQGEETKIIASGEFEVLKNARPESVKVVMSSSGNSFAISANRHIRLYSTLQPQKEFKMILDAHDKPITGLRMSSCGKMIASCGDRYIRIFHNVAEFYSNVILLEKIVQETREDCRKRRFEEQLHEAKQALNPFSFY